MIEGLFVAFMNLSWQMVLIFGMAWLSLAMFRIRSSSARHVIWLAVVLCPLALVPMNILPSEIAIFSVDDFEGVVTTDGSLGLSEPRGKELLGRTTTLQPEVEVFSGHRFLRDIRLKLPLLLICIWAFGAGVGFTRIVAGSITLRKFISRAREVDDERVHTIFTRIKEEMGISRRVRLLISSEARIPFATGFIHPCVVLPDRMSASDEKLRMLLIHELAHLNRFDDLVNLLCRIAGSLMFFHPLFHLASKKLQLLSEEICDGWVIRLNGVRRDYADCLVEFASIGMGGLPIGLCEKQNSMARRIKSIFENEGAFKSMSKKSIAFLSLSASILILMISVVRLVGCTPEPNCTIKGTVRDAVTGQPIAGAKVSDGDYADRGATTDSDGKYSYLTWYEEHSIVAEAPGYKTQGQTLMTKLFGVESEKTVDFALVPE
jgi:beta-lactamase regulating signal transducer with metallopeptidase domain